MYGMRKAEGFSIKYMYEDFGLQIMDHVQKDPICVHTIFEEYMCRHV